MVLPDAKDRTILTLCLPALNATTQNILEHVTHALRFEHLSKACVAAKIALAEVLNNVVEHAYAGVQLGAVAVLVSAGPATVTITVIDWGTAYPNFDIPEDAPPEPTQLAEGGYGWFLIRSLTSQVMYTRSARANILKLTLDI